MATSEDKDLGQQPASPTTAMVEQVAIPTTVGGLTKREEFAKTALLGIRISGATADAAFAAKAAVADADALLAALAAGGAQ